MFHVGFGSAEREAKIRLIAEGDRTTAVILAAVHFEWMLKRAILKLSRSPTSSLREQLEDVFRMHEKNGQDGYKEVWEREVGRQFKNAALGTVLGRLSQIQNHALNVRGRVVHGNGTVSKADANEAIELFLGAGAKLRAFVARHGVDIDARLRTRKSDKSAKA